MRLKVNLDVRHKTINQDGPYECGVGHDAKELVNKPNIPREDVVSVSELRFWCTLQEARARCIDLCKVANSLFELGIGTEESAAFRS